MHPQSGAHIRARLHMHGQTIAQAATSSRGHTLTHADVCARACIDQSNAPNEGTVDGKCEKAGEAAPMEKFGNQ